MGVQTNLATITPEPRRTLDLRAVPQAVRQAGFTPGKTKLDAAGQFEAVEGAIRFRIRGWPETYPVHDGDDWRPDAPVRVRATVEYDRSRPLLHVQQAEQAGQHRENDDRLRNPRHGVSPAPGGTVGCPGYMYG